MLGREGQVEEEEKREKRRGLKADENQGEVKQLRRGRKWWGVN